MSKPVWDKVWQRVGVAVEAARSDIQRIAPVQQRISRVAVVVLQVPTCVLPRHLRPACKEASLQKRTMPASAAAPAEGRALPRRMAALTPGQQALERP